MEINYKYFLYAADFIWLFPVFRQRKTKFFFFFLMYAIDDPIGYFTYFFIIPNTYFSAITFTYLAFISFFDKQILKTQSGLFFGLYILFAMGYFASSDWRVHLVFWLVAQMSLILMVSHSFIQELLKQRFSISIMILISYLLMEIFRGVTYLLFAYDTISGFSYFFNFIGIFIGIFFVIFRMNDDRFFIRL